jgi:ribosomal protein L35
MRSHILGKKNAKRRRRLAEPKRIARPDRGRVRELLRK